MVIHKEEEKGRKKNKEKTKTLLRVTIQEDRKI